MTEGTMWWIEYTQKDCKYVQRGALQAPSAREAKALAYEAFDPTEVVSVGQMMCCDCKNIPANVLWPACDPDIPQHPYCRSCVDEAKTRLMIELANMDR